MYTLSIDVCISNFFVKYIIVYNTSLKQLLVTLTKNVMVCIEWQVVVAIAKFVVAIAITIPN